MVTYLVSLHWSGNSRRRKGEWSTRQNKKKNVGQQKKQEEKWKGRSDIHSLHPTPNPWHYGVKERSSTRCARPCDGRPEGRAAGTVCATQHFALRSKGQASSSIPSGLVLFKGYKTIDSILWNMILKSTVYPSQGGRGLLEARSAPAGRRMWD